MADTYIEMFEEKYYPELFLWFSRETIQYFEHHYEKIKREMSLAICSYLQQLSKWQKQEDGYEVGELSLSFLYTSVSEGNPKFRLDSYGKMGRIYEESILTEYVSAQWLLTYADEFIIRINKCVEEQCLKRYIRASEYEVLKLRAIRSLLGYFAGRFKYVIREIIDMRELARIKKCETFVVEMGEYLDWQHVIYAIVPEVDIFNCDADTILEFRRFPAIHYDDKQLNHLVIKQCEFRDCTFNNCMVQECQFMDCIFDNCIFENASFSNVDFTGTIFIDCVMKSTGFEHGRFFKDESEKEQVEYYEPAEFFQCEFQDTAFMDCQMPYCPVIKCEVNNVTFERCINTNSGFNEIPGIVWR